MDSRLGSDERKLCGSTAQPLIIAALAPLSRTDYH